MAFFPGQSLYASCLVRPAFRESDTLYSLVRFHIVIQLRFRRLSIGQAEGNNRIRNEVTS